MTWQQIKEYLIAVLEDVFDFVLRIIGAKGDSDETV